MKNILIVSHAHFPDNSSIHVHHFANELVKMGLDCVVAVPHDKNTISSIKGNLYSVTQFDEIEKIQDLFANHQSPDLVHAWTPREHVRNYCYALSIKHEFKLVIHLEDNEEQIIERFLKVPLDQWSPEHDSLVPYNLSHPVKYKEFMATADGVTVIIDKLAEFAPLSASTITLYPGVDREEFYPQPKDSELLESLGLKDGTTILCYTGNVHLANIDEVRCLYLAVGKRNQAGKPTVLIRTGTDHNVQILDRDQLWIKKHVIELGWIDRQEMPKILALADVLVQPGKPDKFNDYRFPSKIPEFLAMKKPVIIPDSNIGKVLTHEENALILESVDENSLPAIIDFIVENPDLSHKLAENALKFVDKNLNWAHGGHQLYSFYKSLFAEEKLPTALRHALVRSQLYCQDLKNTYQTNPNQTDIRELELEINSIKISSQIRIEELELEIDAMKTSKFWKAREQWFKVKQALPSRRR